MPLRRHPRGSSNKTAAARSTIANSQGSAVIASPYRYSLLSTNDMDAVIRCQAPVGPYAASEHRLAASARSLRF
jgi:hypothetical protein